MVKIAIGKRPDLTYELLEGILQKNLSYRVDMWQGLGKGVSIWKNELLGAIVKIKQEPHTTYLICEMNPPSLIIRLICCLFGLVLGLIILFLASGSFARQVAEEIKLMPEFQQAV